MILSKRLYLIAVCILFATACSTNIRTTVTSFGDSSGLQSGKHIAIIPASESSPSGSEFQYYAAELAKHFEAKGLTAITEKSSDYVVKLSFQVDRQALDEQRSRTQVHTGIGLYSNSRSSIAVLDQRETLYEYVRKVEFGVYSRVDMNEVAKFSAVSHGRCKYLPSVYNEMLAAIFKNMERSNGSVVQVSIAANKPCAVRE
ncbi:MAG: hypothetical protein ACI93R_000635 [Flavobacteriales bacterium]|jgi:hypothetical protein